jgi:hypothetical protein
MKLPIALRGSLGVSTPCERSSMASSNRFASKSEPHLPITPEQKRKRRGTANTKPPRSQENNNTRKGSKDTRLFAREWPFPRRERSSHSPPHKSQRHSIDRFFESSEYHRVFVES